MDTYRPELECRPLPDFDIGNWDEIEKAFCKTDRCVTGQAWLKERHPDFQEAEIRVGWRPEALHVYAKLADLDIYNEEMTFNAPSFKKGDAFEMFLRPLSQDSYFEVHVTPFNQKFQLRIPEKDYLRKTAGKDRDIDLFVHEPIESRARILKDEGRWEVLAILPFSLISENEKVKEGSEWLFSFSRYDYYRKLKDPVHSSTSPHKILNFHIQEEWGRMIFKNAQSNT